MSLGNIFKALAPIAAGAAFGPGGTLLAGSAGTAGSAVAAGALTGAGIAALSGDDPLMGAVSGGLGGYGGAGVGQAMRATALPAGAQTTASGITFDTATGQTLGSGLGGGAGYTTISPTLGEGFKASINNPKAFLSNFGGGARFDGNKMITESEAAKKGALKLGAVGLPAIGQAMIPEYNANPDDNPMSKYDPKRRLNLNMPTGIQNALTRDSGLRLLQGGGYLGGDDISTRTWFSNLFGKDDPQLGGEGYLPYRFRDSGNFTPEDQEAYRQYMIERDMYEPREAPVYDPRLQQLENERAARMRDPQVLENERARVLRRTDPYVGTEKQSRDRFNALMDIFEQQRLEIKAMPEGPEKEEIMRMNDNFSRDEFYYNQGGYLETGMGDGMSDDIATSIEGEQPARLSENEFVVPADVVSHLGNGSSDAGAEQLYSMLDRVREARTGTEEQGREISAERFLPA